MADSSSKISTKLPSPLTPANYALWLSQLKDLLFALAKLGSIDHIREALVELADNF